MPRRDQTPEWELVAQAFGHRVRLLREERGLTQEELAQAAGISRNQLQNIENSRNNVRDAQGRQGRGNPRLDTVWSLAGALQVEVADLVPHRHLGRHPAEQS